ncbi:hypothetical protein IAR55_003848 [Kwoniella newhampshirensis]|uniref:Short-chain dehydrogenase n=1 Tax=Kwoniella newhampshirensis TaxID=1651941 RepID=A0AAW0YYD5_9TREE
MSTPWSIYRKLWSPLPPAPKGSYLAGKNLIITGANSGVGLEAVKQFAAAKPAKLILAVRSVEPTEKILDKIKQAHPGLDAEVMHVDLTSLESVKQFTQEVEKKLGRVDVLFNNAGMNPNFEVKPMVATVDGYERTFQVNILAPLMTTLYLLPALRRSKSPQVLFTGSDIVFFGDETAIKNAFDQGVPFVKAFNDPDTYDNPNRYAHSKLLLQMMTRALMPALPDMVVINVNPGLARTNLGREFDLSFSFALIRMIIWFMVNSRSAAKAARSLTTAVAYGKESEDYWSECVPTPVENTYLNSGKGIRATRLFFQEMLAEAEKISPGITKTLEL